MPLTPQTFCDSTRDGDLEAMHSSFRTLQQIMRSAARRAGVEFFDAAASIDPAVCTTRSLIVDATAFNYIERNGAGLLHPTNAGSAAIGSGLESFIEVRLSQEPVDPGLLVGAGGLGN